MLANVFYRLHLIEAYGTGIGKIMKAYENVKEKPIIKTSKNAFKIILPNINAKDDDQTNDLVSNENIPNDILANEDEEKVLEYTKTHGNITRSDVIDLLKVSSATAFRVLNYLVKLNLLTRHKKARSTYYTLA